ncbi:aminotransferase class I/II-fold pyridoxal phosphate-dependent enzyme [Thermovibrio ammonificans]|jgi:aspartate/methionine/tyrosine aminotransferase
MEKFQIEPFYVMQVLERAKELEKRGREVIHLEIGEPDLPVPERVKRKAAELLTETELKYTPATGIPKLKEAIAEFYYSRYRVVVEPEQVVVTPGSSPGLVAALKTVSRLVGEISFTDPGYPCYKNTLKVLGEEGVALPVGPENSFKVRPFQVNTPALIVNSPANPTGAVYTKRELEKLSKRAFLISDEIYHGLTYGEEAPSALEVTRNCIVVNGFSKFFLMTGWRVGWLIVPPEMVEPINAILQNTVIAPPTLSQLAAVECFSEEVLSELQENVKVFRKRKEILLNGLKEIGFKVPVEPKGAFYIWADASPFTEDSFKFAFELLERTSVAVTPGRDFGYNGTEKFVRFSFCTETEKILEALERLYSYLR